MYNQQPHAQVSNDKKILMTFCIDPVLAEMFRNRCKKDVRKLSNVAESLMRKYVNI